MRDGLKAQRFAQSGKPPPPRGTAQRAKALKRAPALSLLEAIQRLTGCETLDQLARQKYFDLRFIKNSTPSEPGYYGMRALGRQWAAGNWSRPLVQVLEGLSDGERAALLHEIASMSNTGQVIAL